jgi:hypothetical protein
MTKEWFCSLDINNYFNSVMFPYCYTTVCGSNINSDGFYFPLESTCAVSMKFKDERNFQYSPKKILPNYVGKNFAHFRFFILLLWQQKTMISLIQTSFRLLIILPPISLTIFLLISSSENIPNILWIKKLLENIFNIEK